MEEAVECWIVKGSNQGVLKHTQSPPLNTYPIYIDLPDCSKPFSLTLKILDQYRLHLAWSWCFSLLCLCAGLQGMPGDMYGSPAVTSSYTQMQRPPVHSQAMLIPGHPHHMMMAHTSMGHHGMGLPSAQSPPLHAGMDSMAGHIQDIHAG